MAIKECKECTAYGITCQEKDGITTVYFYSSVSMIQAPPIDQCKAKNGIESHETVAGNLRSMNTKFTEHWGGYSEDN